MNKKQEFQPAASSKLARARAVQPAQASRAESIECKNEMDPFPHLIDLFLQNCIYIETFTLFKTADKFVFK